MNGISAKVRKTYHLLWIKKFLHKPPHKVIDDVGDNGMYFGAVTFSKFLRK